MIKDLGNIVHGVSYLTPKTDALSKEYLALREKEGRILNDAEVRELPKTSDANPNEREWELRKRSADRFLKYLGKINKPITILDIGCGNGWFSNAMASVSPQNNVVGLDINVPELEQAARVFKDDNLHFVYANLFKLNDEFYAQFDLIVLNASVQYFKDIKVLMTQIIRFLKPKGEVHILDSPFYPISEINAAKARSLQYYERMGFPKMSNRYYHHSLESIKDFETLYRPKGKLISLLKGRKDSPFLWLKYQKS